MSEKYPYKEIGRSLQAMRKNAGFKSARAFAEQVGVVVTAYTEYEQGRRMFTVAQAWHFADALGCTIDAMVGRDFPSTLSASPEELALVDAYRQCTTRERQAIMNTAQTMADDGNAKNNPLLEPGEGAA